MHKMNGSTYLGAAGLTASFFGVLAAGGAMTHGVGEVLQGNVKPKGLFIPSWTQGPIAANMGGEPGITVVPNVLLSGLLTILISAAMLVWAILFIRRKNGGRVLIALATAVLLVGGGIGPPLIGMLAGTAGTQIGKPLGGWRSRLAPQMRGMLASVWPVLFLVAAASATFLVIGSLILVFLFGLNNAALFLNTFYLTVLSLTLTVLLAPFRDNRDGERLELAAE